MQYHRSRPFRSSLHAESNRTTAVAVSVAIGGLFLTQLVFAISCVVRGTATPGSLPWPCGLAVGAAFVIWLICRSTPPLFATDEGVQIGEGESSVRVPWRKIHDIARIPGFNATTSYWSRWYRIKFVNGAQYDFVGPLDVLERIEPYLELDDDEDELDEESS